MISDIWFVVFPLSYAAITGMIYLTTGRAQFCHQKSDHMQAPIGRKSLESFKEWNFLLRRH